MNVMFANTSAPFNTWKPVDLIYENQEKLSKLFLGNIGSYNNKIFLMENKIRAIVSICPEVISPKSDEFILDHLLLPILDSEKAEIFEELDRVADFVEKHMNLGNSVLVHCMAGSSRSAAFVIGYLMRKNNWCFEKTYLFVKEKRAQVFPNSGFQRQLRMYEKKLFFNKENKSLEK